MALATVDRIKSHGERPQMPAQAARHPLVGDGEPVSVPVSLCGTTL